MKWTLTNLAIAAVVAYVLYMYFTRESMTNTATIGTAFAVVIGVVLLGAAYMYVSSK